MKRRRWTPGDDGTEPSFLAGNPPSIRSGRDLSPSSLAGVDLAEVHPAPRQPRWDAPVNSPSVPVFILGACLGILFAFAVLELAEWLGR